MTKNDPPTDVGAKQHDGPASETTLPEYPSPSTANLEGEVPPQGHDAEPAHELLQTTGVEGAGSDDQQHVDERMAKNRWDGIGALHRQDWKAAPQNVRISFARTVLLKGTL
jgi:hypothetical protein